MFVTLQNNIYESTPPIASSPVYIDELEYVTLNNSVQLPENLQS
jgi:hypothetical protein